ncbi:ML domain-containing protein [Streptomyces sp. NPDC005828]|uniref:ML domain-containing protein n=1 Tax=Streptomyces sp. NPDC005828 TaxID=3157071 RepID=UPI0033F2915B
MTGWNYTNVGLPTDALQIESVTVTPDPPKPGAEAKMVIKGTVQTAIEDGAYFDLTVKLGLIKLLHKQFDLFEELRNGSSSEGWSATPDPAGGPIKPGPVELTYVMQLSREIPQGRFKVHFRAFTADEDDLAALDFDFDFMSTAS